MKRTRIIGSLMVLGMVFSLADKIPAQTICDSIVPIDSIYYYTHQLPYTILDTNNLPKKTGHELQFQFGDSLLRLKDLTDSFPNNLYYYCEYSIIGMDKKKNWTLVEFDCPSWNGCYVINPIRKTIDTLDGYPNIFGNTMLNSSFAYTDAPRCIEVRKIEGDKLVLIRKVCTKIKCFIFPDDFALSDNNELMFTERYKVNRDDWNHRYWKLKL